MNASVMAVTRLVAPAPMFRCSSDAARRARITFGHVPCALFVAREDAPDVFLFCRAHRKSAKSRRRKCQTTHPRLRVSSFLKEFLLRPCVSPVGVFEKRKKNPAQQKR
jgi:hypothetical protein